MEASALIFNLGVCQMSPKKSAGLLAVIIYLFLPAKYLLAQDIKLPDNSNGKYVTTEKFDFVDKIIGQKPATLYRTVDGLIIDNYNAQTDGSDTVTVKMNVYNPLMISGKVKVYNPDGTIDIDNKANKDIEARSNIGKNIIDQGAKMVTEYINAAQGKDGTFLDIFKYSALDPRVNIPSQEIKVTLKPGQTVEITNKDKESLSSQKAEAIYDLVFAIAKTGNKKEPDKAIKQRFIEAFKEALEKELNTPIIAGNINLIEAIKEGKTLDQIVDKPAFEKTIEILNELLKKSVKVSGDTAYDTLTDTLSEGTGIALKAIGAGGVAVASDVVYGIVNIGTPLIKLDIIGKINNLPKSPGLLIANNDGSIFYSTSTVRIPVPLNTYPTDVMLSGITGITQTGSSPIGSASNHFPITTYTQFKAADRPVQDELNRGQFRPITDQAKDTYTNGTIVKAPLDIGLTWNQSTKLDLDSHTVTPSGDHVYYDQRGSLTNSPNTFLYRDSIPASGTLGAEQTRITTFQEGEYRFYVYNYSDQQNLAPAGLSNSSAKVQLFQGGGLLSDIPNDPNVFNLNDPNLQKVGQPYPGTNTFNVPTGQSGNAWYVFKLNTRTGILNRVDRFSNVDSSSNIPKFK
jgi:hypothetical protein